MSDVPSALEQRRLKLGLTKFAWAARLGIANTHYGEISLGQRRVSATLLQSAYRNGVPAKLLLVGALRKS